MPVTSSQHGRHPKWTDLPVVASTFPRECTFGPGVPCCRFFGWFFSTEPHTTPGFRPFEPPQRDTLDYD
ncbi:hypothetical protein MTP99_006518 [Tenebrio molitor]|nr:hypothetical protein MTP99_006518 [Tenebrio molitor]